MLSPRLTECLECANISSLLSEIDCKLADLAKAEYNNLVFSLNRPIQGILISDLLAYKRILTNRLCNPDYACDYSLNMIASRVKTLHPILCKPNCQEKDFKFNISSSNPYFPQSTTTSTSSTSSTSTTSTSTTPAPIVIVPICLTYASIGGCVATCGLECSTYYMNSICANYINTNAAPQALGCIVYTDPLGTVPAPDGWYSRPGGLCYILGSSFNNGEITGITLCQ